MKISLLNRNWLAVVAALLFAANSPAEVHLANLFSDGAVLQRGINIPIWGTAEVGESVRVNLNGKQAKTVADDSGHWMVKFPALQAGGPYDMTVSGKNETVIHNVVIGEVWVASGQSNMEFPLNTFNTNDPVYGPKSRTEVATANDSLLRMFTVAKKISPSACVGNYPGPDGSWKSATPADAGKFSAVAYYYARELRCKLNVPVGIIHTSWAGTPAEAWTCHDILEADARLHTILERWDKLLAHYDPADEKKYAEEILPAWQQAVQKAKVEGQPTPAKPRPPMGPNHPYRPSTLFNGMLNPLIPYGIRGAIWYQGEANAGDGQIYKVLFPSMIKDWRSRWNLGDFPFLYVQLANYQAPQKLPVEPGWTLLREAQLMTLATTNTGMASAIDLADAENPDDIHPHNKREVGRRLSLIALGTVYGQSVSSYSGPIYSGNKISGNEVRLSFTHVDGGLIAQGDYLKGFAIAGKDGKFVWADASIQGNQVVVTSPQVAEPAAVRYGWAKNPIGNLYNKEGLPASPFRTDDWKTN